MSNNRYRVKKHRFLKRTEHIVECCASVEECASSCNNESITDQTDLNSSENAVSTSAISLNENAEILNATTSSTRNTVSEVLNSSTSSNTSNENINISFESTSNSGINEKIRQWALRNLNTLQLKVITELLLLLREEGFHSLPKTAQSLLGTTHRRVLQMMETCKRNNGEYTYLGIENGLKQIISPNLYLEDEIKVFVHIDGMQVYNNSQVQVWPITMKVFHEEYISHPYVVAIYCGDSKPKNVCDYLYDFVQEARTLIESGVTIGGKNYSFKVIALIADAPARSFLKCIKSSGGYYACERCTTKGQTIGQGRCKKRIYPEMNRSLRTKDSFINKAQINHHTVGLETPLLQIPNFDPVYSVVLDSMHLLYSGVMKYLMDKWISRNSASRLRLQHVNCLRRIMTSLSRDVPSEFQRKKFDISYFSQWKATQYRFFLLYCGPVVMKSILSQDRYEHFMLLCVACRLLHSKTQMIIHNNYAKGLLRDFFESLEEFCGSGCQVLVMHNLIHMSDDVRHHNISLSDLSAFWGENYISLFKKLVKSPNKPLTQIINRLSELQNNQNLRVKKRSVISECILSKHYDIFVHRDQNGLSAEYIVVSSVKIKNATFNSNHPNNVAKLSDVFRIKKILLKKSDDNERVWTINDLFILGEKLVRPRALFTYPTSSIDVGITVGDGFSELEELLPMKDIKSKCVLLHHNNQYYAIALLHN